MNWTTEFHQQKEAIVKSDTLKKGLVTLIVIFGLCVMVLLGLGSWTRADENMPVTCYKDKSRIGTVSVYDWRTAAVTCNRILYDCRGTCMGCFRDSDYISDVCIDAYGREFLR